MPTSDYQRESMIMRGRFRLFAFCHACGRSARLPDRVAVRLANRVTTKQKLALALKCQGCGERSAWPMWVERP